MAGAATARKPLPAIRPCAGGSPSQRHGRQDDSRNRIRLSRNRPCAARGVTTVRNTSRSVHARMTTPTTSAPHSIEQEA